MINDIKITINNDRCVNVPVKTTIEQLALQNFDVCQDKIIGAKINNEIVDFSYELKKDCNIEFFDINTLDGYKMNQAGLKFVLECAIKDYFNQDIEISFDHSIGNGIHTTILNYNNFTKEDTAKLKKYMDDIIKADDKFTKLNIHAKEATVFYSMLHIDEKSANIHNLSNSIIVLYKLRNHFNYFYQELPYSTSYLNDFELVYIDNNEIAIVLPTNHTFNLVEYKKYNKITECFKQDMNLLKSYKMSYLCDINKEVSLGHSRDVIRLFETHFDNKIHEVAIKAIENSVKYLLIAGPSSSGKTTTAKKIALNLRAEGYETLLISTDDYFVNVENSPKKEDGSYDFEALECVDIKALNKDLKDLIEGKEVVIPSYNFRLGKREYINEPIKLGEKSIIIMEGIHCLNDKLTPELNSNDKMKVYLSPFIPVRIDRHNYLSTTDLRLVRRIIRDNNNRGCNIAKTIEMWKNVREGEETNIFPFVDNADVIINTALPYELGVLKVFAEPLLYSIGPSSKYYEEARRLIRYFENIFPIASEYVEEDSILREFIGGSVFKKEGDI